MSANRKPPGAVKTDRRESLRLASLSALAPALSSPAEVGPHTGDRNGPGRSQPNVIIIMADQHQAGLTKRSGFPLDTMPTLDRLAATGVSFDRAYACAPLCVPSRVSLLTGRWPHAHRVRQNSAPDYAVFTKDIFDVVKPLGYRTGLAGKNHSYLKPGKLDFWRQYTHLKGWQPKNAAKEVVAFDQWLVMENFAIEPTPAPFPAEVQHPYRIVSDGIDFIASTDTRLTKALSNKINPFIAVLMGVMTGVGGETIQDILLARIPAVLRADVYATET